MESEKLDAMIIGSREFDTIEYHLCAAWRKEGHACEIFDITDVTRLSRRTGYWLKRFSERYDRWVADRLFHQVARLRPDVLICTYRDIHPRLIDRVKRSFPETITLHVNPDALVNLQNQQILASAYDYYFTKDPFIRDFMSKKAGCNAYYLPESFSTEVHQRPNDDREKLEEEIDIDVLIFGSIYPYRARMIEQLVENDINVTVFGKKGPYFPARLQSVFHNRRILGQEKSRILFGSRIVLNNMHYSEIEGVNCKYFEINGVGAFQLCDYKSTLREYSPVDPERYAFHSIGNAVQLIKHYLSHPVERHEIAEIQYEHFQESHTYTHRVRDIIEIISN